ncbi:hypothetical protein QBC35DRAFT_208530 [Podospora australis]|uniref:Uncharacterized protein n=1 Tax=Podospora australis TaxID=1536484 RepID=A0AAN6WUB1_9PEZI|nr:hypothetical protein QBC35DRAFT_208530 [Podospora australis]
MDIYKNTSPIGGGSHQPNYNSPDAIPGGHDTHVYHYPLDVPVSFDRYDHRKLTARDIMVHRLMAGFMNCSKIPKDVFAYLTNPSYRDSNWTPDFVTDLLVANRLLLTRPETDETHLYLYEYILSTVTRHFLESDNIAFRTWATRAAPPRKPDGPLSNDTGGSIHRPDRKSRRRLFDLKLDRQRIWDGKVWDEGSTEHVQSIRDRLTIQDHLPIYDGGSVLPNLRKTLDRDNCSVHGARMAMRDTHWTISTTLPGRCHFPLFPENHPTMRWMQPNGPRHKTWFLDMTANPGRGRLPHRAWHSGWQAPIRPPGKHGLLPCWEYGPRRSRSSSEPPPGAISIVRLPSLPRHDFVIAFPAMTPLYLDSRTRRRSLSRTRIRELFDWDTDLWSHPLRMGSDNFLPKARAWRAAIRHRCENCAKPGHNWTDCDAPCGHCGAPSPKSYREYIEPICDFGKDQNLRPVYESDDNPYLLPGYHQNPHYAPDCPVPVSSRCKCVRFPTFHTAKRCGIPCRRTCGNPNRTGSFKHKNAMTCKSRCCMCGVRNDHSGKDCKLKTCRCREPHLGQDCTWNPACVAPDCDRYLCGMHCHQCGKAERPLVGQEKKCWKCAGLREPLPPNPTKLEKRRRKKERQPTYKGVGRAPESDGRSPDTPFSIPPENPVAQVVEDGGNGNGNEGDGHGGDNVKGIQTWVSIFGDGVLLQEKERVGRRKSF